MASSNQNPLDRSFNKYSLVRNFGDKLKAAGAKGGQSAKLRKCGLRSPRKELTEEEKKFVKKILESSVANRRREGFEEDLLNGPLSRVDPIDQEIIMSELLVLLNRHAEDLLVVCHGMTAGGGGAMGEAEKKIKSLEKRLLDSQKAYLQEVVAMRDKVRKVELNTEDVEDVGTIFFDPLCHIDDEQKKFLSDAIEEKMKNALDRRGSSNHRPIAPKVENSWEMRQLKKDLEAKKLELDDLKAKVVALTAQKNTAEEALEAEKRKHAEGGSQLEELQKAREELSKECRRLKKALNDNEVELEKLKQELDAKDAANDKDAQLKQQRFRIDTLEREIGLEKVRVQEFEKKQSQIQKDADGRVAAANQEVSSLRRQLEDLQKQLQAERDKPKAKEKEKEKEKEKPQPVSGGGDGGAAARAEVEKYKAEIKQMKQKLAEQQSCQTKEVEGVADDLKLALAASEAECERLRLLLAELQNKFSSLKTAAEGDVRLSQMLDGSGLGDAIHKGLGSGSFRGVFRRLYDDAMNRLVRMAELRHRFFQEIAEAWGPPLSPSAATRELVAPFHHDEKKPPAEVELRPVDIGQDVKPNEGANSAKADPESPKVSKVPRWLLGVQKTYENARNDYHVPTSMPGIQAAFPPPQNVSSVAHLPRVIRSDGRLELQSVGNLKVSQLLYTGENLGSTKGGGGLRLPGPVPIAEGKHAVAYVLDKNWRGDASGRSERVNGFGGPLGGVSRPGNGKPVGLAGSKAVSLPLLT